MVARRGVDDNGETTGRTGLRAAAASQGLGYEDRPLSSAKPARIEGPSDSPLTPDSRERSSLAATKRASDWEGALSLGWALELSGSPHLQTVRHPRPASLHGYLAPARSNNKTGSRSRDSARRDRAGTSVAGAPHRAAH